MPISSLYCPLPIRNRQVVAPRDYGRRDRAIELFAELRHHDAVRETLAYLLPGLAIPDLNQEAFCFVQGSARVRIQIVEDQLAVSTVLAALKPAAQATAALRFFLTRISGTGQLFQPRLDAGVISLAFSEPLALMHPLKLVELLQRMPNEADRNDAWMIEQFGVETPDREPVEPLDAAEFGRAWEIWTAHWHAVDELMIESRRRRSVRFLDALGSFAANQLHYLLPMSGSVRARLIEAANTFNDRDEHPEKRDSALAKCAKAMAKFSAEELKLCLGHAHFAINPLDEGTPSLLTSTLGSGGHMQTIVDLRATGRAMEATLELLSYYLYLLAHHSWTAEVEAALRKGLDLVSDKPWREAADALWNHANATARELGSHGERDRDTDRPGASGVGYE